MVCYGALRQCPSFHNLINTSFLPITRNQKLLLPCTQRKTPNSNHDRSRRCSLVVESVAKRSPKRLKYRFSSPRKVPEVVYVSVDSTGSDAWKLEPIIKMLKDGAVGVIPTDTVYAIVCNLKNPLSVDRIYRIKDMDPKKPLSILCRSFKDIDTYTTGFPRGNSQGHTNIFRAARQCLPGPYTFVLPASKEMPKQCTNFGGSAQSCAPRKSVGVRMPKDIICQAILQELDDPLICTRLKRFCFMREDHFCVGVDFVVDGGIRIADPSTVVDMTGTKPFLLRRGKGIVEDWMLMEIQNSVQTDFLMANPYA